MKKLLLIMICLFASFEVKSESDDLSGKKLLCNNFNINSYQKDPPDLIEVELLGYEFVSKMKEDDFNFHKRNNSKDYTVRPNYNLVFRYYLNLLNDTDSFDKDLLNYETTLQNIVILKNYKYKNLDGDLRIAFERDQLSRETLNFHKHFNCQIVEELNSYFEERLDKKIKYMKSKQKI